MACLTVAGIGLLSLLCSAGSGTVASQGSHNLTVRSGEDAVLLCEDVTHTVPALLVWIRPELKSEGFIYFDRGDDSGESYQLSLYRGRVELRVPHMTDGNMSVVLKNVTMNDTGTYECRIEKGPPGRTRRGEPELITAIHLKVEDSGYMTGNTKDGGSEDGGSEDGGSEDGGSEDGGSEDGHSRGHVGLQVAVSLFLCGVLVLVFIIVKYKKNQEPKSI
ncbi:hypothetical protein Q5P01_003055 [Channa striata]|uniref:Ig-like domain-containing protein n=1 Tax=Channa striata TaxID=64152 RepID=A0AA88T5C0_CHASR|nr:hypothetical protein Q5P01_003055 [Channa striata]